MKKTTKAILALCMAVAMVAAMTGTAFASGSTTVNLKSYEGALDDVVSLSNVVGTGNMAYIDGKDLPTYFCNSPAEVKVISDVNLLMAQKVTDINLEKAKRGEGFWMERMPVKGQATIWDAKTEKELTIDYKNIDNYELDIPPEIHAGATVTLSEKGVYIIQCAIAPYSDSIWAIVIVDGGNPTTAQATPTASGVLVNGKQTAFDAYTIGGNNYFKLRDLAYAISGSDKQFEITWDGANNAILLTSGMPYTPVGGEMESKGTDTGGKTAVPSSSKILFNGKEIALTAYTIGGNNYFKLRDIGEVYNFGVTWDGAKNTIIIDTKAEYTK